MRPIAQSDGGDDLGNVDEPAPSVAGGVDDVGVGLEDAVGEPVRTQVVVREEGDLTAIGAQAAA